MTRWRPSVLSKLPRYGASLLALGLDRHVDGRLLEALDPEERRVPAAPDDGQLRPRGLRGPRDEDRVPYRRARQDRHAEAERAVELPKDKDILKIEKLTGSAVAGAKFSGRITGGKVSDGLKYSWETDFDFTLPAKFAFGGLGCGG